MNFNTNDFLWHTWNCRKTVCMLLIEIKWYHWLTLNDMMNFLYKWLICFFLFWQFSDVTTNYSVIYRSKCFCFFHFKTQNTTLTPYKHFLLLRPHIWRTVYHNMYLHAINQKTTFFGKWKPFQADLLHNELCTNVVHTFFVFLFKYIQIF